ncbi:MAG: polysaccharide deacetylase family protein [Sandaracinaceae bacterium]
MSTARWYIKKAARAGVALGTWASGSLRAERLVRATLRGAPRVRVLTYHRVGEASRDAFCVSREDFDAQMRTLSEQRLAVSLDDVHAFVAGQRTLPDGACLVTLDDGCLSTLTEALPILERWSVPAVAYVSAGLIGIRHESLPERFLDWDEVRALAKSAVMTVGSHSHTHRSLGLMDPAEARDEAQRSKDTLEAELGEPVVTFAYPFGTYSDFSPVTERALADAGYTICFNSIHGAIRPGMDPISLPRVKVEGGEALWMFHLTRQGAMDPWRLVDRNLWRLQRDRTEIQ